MADLAKMSDDQLVAANQKLMAEKDAIREKQEAINAELSARAAASRAELAEGGVVTIEDGGGS